MVNNSDRYSGPVPLMTEKLMSRTRPFKCWYVLFSLLEGSRSFTPIGGQDHFLAGVSHDTIFRFSFQQLGIQRARGKDEIRDSLELRREINVDPYLSETSSLIEPHIPDMSRCRSKGAMLCNCWGVGRGVQSPGSMQRSSWRSDATHVRKLSLDHKFVLQNSDVPDWRK